LHEWLTMPGIQIDLAGKIILITRAMSVNF